MKFSVVIPAHNEEGSIEPTARGIVEVFEREEIDYEILVVDDASTDRTATVVARISENNPRVRCVRSPYRNGFGFAVRAGLNEYGGDAVAIVMADGSDDPEDLLSYYRLLLAGFDCAFGSRFIQGSRV